MVSVSEFTNIFSPLVLVIFTDYFWLVLNSDNQSLKVTNKFDKNSVKMDELKSFKTKVCFSQPKKGLLATWVPLSLQNQHFIKPKTIMIWIRPIKCLCELVMFSESYSLTIVSVSENYSLTFYKVSDSGIH